MATVKAIMNPMRRQSKQQKDMLGFVSKLEVTGDKDAEDHGVEMDLSELGLPSLPKTTAEEANAEDTTPPAIPEQADDGWEAAAPPTTAAGMDFDSIMKNAAAAVRICSSQIESRACLFSFKLANT